MRTKFQSGNLNGRDIFGDLDIDGNCHKNIERGDVNWIRLPLDRVQWFVPCEYDSVKSIN